jgi:hypothetical protein
MITDAQRHSGLGAARFQRAGCGILPEPSPAQLAKKASGKMPDGARKMRALPRGDGPRTGLPN